MPFENIFILANGDIFEISKGSARVTGFTNGDAVLIDGASVGEVDNSVLRERKLLSDDGVVAISLAVSKKTGEMMAQPVVSAMGFLYDSEHVKIEAACRPACGERGCPHCRQRQEGAGGGCLRPAARPAALLPLRAHQAPPGRNDQFD